MSTVKNTVSPEYASQLKILHSESKAFGVGNVTSKHYPLIKGTILKRGYESVLDYGCGKGHFITFARRELPNLRVEGFDVASDEFGSMPSGVFDMVICLDVMEHVEFGALSFVLDEIRAKAGKLFICSVANYPAGKKLPDGRNAHVTQLPFSTWFTIFGSFFRVDQFVRTGKAEGLFICSPLQTQSDWR
jgi:SAM-dependent methyltransferase